MTNTVRMRPLTEADAPQWRGLRLRMLREHPEAFGSAYEDQVHWPFDRFVQRLHEANTPDNLILGAFAGEELIGSVGMARDDGAKQRHKAAIASVYVAPEVRGRGVARALFDEIISRARSLPGLEQLYLGVGVDSVAARALYLALGFEVYGRERRALKVGDRYVDEELMVLWLYRPPAP